MQMQETNARIAGIFKLPRIRQGTMNKSGKIF